MGAPSSFYTAGGQLVTVNNIIPHGVLVGESGPSISCLTAMTNGQLLVGQTNADPSPLTLSGDATLNAAAVLTLATTGVVGGTYGDATHVPQITVDAKGRLTVANSVALTFVTSVALGMPGIFNVSGSPVTSVGTLIATLATQAANIVFAGPSSGGAVAPAFRALVGADLPIFSTSTPGAVPSSPGNTTTFLRADGQWIAPAGGGGGGTPGGANTQVQYNNNSAFGGITNLVTDGTNPLLAASAAPATPAAGKGAVYEDSTNKVLCLKNDAGTVSSTVVPSSAAAHQFATAISAAGVVTWTQPAYSDLSGSIIGGSSTQLQYNNSGVFGGISGSSVSSNGSVGLGGATVTTSDPVLNLTQTWNASGVTFTGLKLNVTNTASAAGSLYLDLQQGGTSLFAVGTPGAGFAKLIAQGGMDVAIGSTTIFRIGTPYIDMGPSGMYFATAGIGTQDIGIFPEAASILAQRAGTHAQTLRVYNTFTDASNYERGVFDWTTTTNFLTIGSQSAGTGSQRHVTFVAASSPYFQIFAGAAGGPCWCLVGQELISNSNGCINFTNSTSSFAAGSRDSGLNRIAPKVLGFTDGTVAGGSLTGWYQWVGQTRVTADFTVTSSTTLTNVTGLSVNVQAGRTYQFETELYVTDAAAGGVQAAIAGTATATNIQYTGYTIADNAIKAKTNATALATAVGSTVTTETTGIIVRITGTITVNAAGTLTVQMAQNTSNATATTAKRGSWFLVQDMP